MLPPWLDKALLSIVDAGFAAMPRPRPSPEQAQRVRILSHRGERDDRQVIENTFEAFDPLIGSGVWGLEFDIRWSKDLQPVVIHDATAERGHGIPLRLSECTREAFRRAVPAAPTLEAFIERYAEHFHLMIELKPERYPDPAMQADRLRHCLGDLQPVRDYHLMSLDPELLAALPGFDPACLIPIARFNARAVSQIAAQQRYGGIGGHYLLFGNSLLRQHHEAGRKVGIGFPDSRFSLYREISREADWLFSNRALAMEKLRQELLN